MEFNLGSRDLIAMNFTAFPTRSPIPAPIVSVNYAESFYREAFQQAGISIAMVAMDGRFLNINRAFCRLLGYDELDMLEKTFQAITHPEDLELDLAQARSLARGEISQYSMEKRYIRSDGSSIWVQLHVGIVKDNDVPLYYVAQAEDISARKTAEVERDRALAQTQAVLDSATTVAIIATDIDGTINIFNAGAEEMLGYRANDLVGKSTPAIFHVHSEIEARGRELTRRFGRTIKGFDVFVELARHGELDEREWTYIKKDGSPITINLVVTAQRDLDGTLVGFQGIATDITVRKQQELELEALNQHLSKLALNDSLTGLDNRRSILSRLEKIWNTQNATDPLSVIIMDIDHFKKINDCLGHHAGDNVLERVAKVIKNSIRLVDFCGRYGGEEFLVVCPATSVCAAACIAEKIRYAVEQQLKDIQGDNIAGVTISLGVADRREGSASIIELIGAADLRLYKAKELGRNRLIFQ